MPLPLDHAKKILMSALESSADLDTHSSERSLKKQAVMDRHAQISGTSSNVSKDTAFLPETKLQSTIQGEELYCMPAQYSLRSPGMHD